MTTDIEALRKAITESGKTYTNLAKQAGISRVTLYNRMNKVGEFTASEIYGLAKALKMTKAQRDRIFFGLKVEGDSTSKED